MCVAAVAQTLWIHLINFLKAGPRGIVKHLWPQVWGKGLWNCGFI